MSSTTASWPAIKALAWVFVLLLGGAAAASAQSSEASTDESQPNSDAGQANADEPPGEPADGADGEQAAEADNESGAAEGPDAAAEDVGARDVGIEVFEAALEDFYDEDYADAAAGFFDYIRGREGGVPKFESAQFFLARCLEKLGFWHGAVYYYFTVANNRSEPKLLPDALQALERITRERPFSETLVHETLLYDSEFGFLPPHLKQWVNYIQGLYDLRNGFNRWSKQHFEALPEQSVYGLKARYARAVWRVKRGHDAKAIAMFRDVVASDVAAPDVKNDAYLALARLHFDRGEYAEALDAYNRVEQIELSFEQAELLLEKAWTTFYLGDYRKTMGYLEALRAPSYREYFLPDAYLLRGLCFKRLCHYMRAKRMVRAFRLDYGRALGGLHRREPMGDIRRLRIAAVQHGKIARITKFLRALRRQRARIEDYDWQWEDVELDAHLRTLYDRETRAQRRQWRLRFDDAADAVALRLLQAHEQMQLLDYEIGVAIFDRLQAGQGKKETEKMLTIPYDSAKVYYEHQTEFWNDELHDYQYFIEDRCFESRESQ